MSTFLKSLLVLSFLSSLLVGEQLCCDELSIAATEVSKQAASEVKKTEISSEEAKSHFCEHSSESSESNHDKTHNCIGCSHSPFVKANSNSIKPFQVLSKNYQLSNLSFKPRPFLDGPFFPPRA